MKSPHQPASSSFPITGELSSCPLCGRFPRAYQAPLLSPAWFWFACPCTSTEPSRVDAEAAAEWQRLAYLSTPPLF